MKGRLAIGIDGGGSRSEARLWRDGSELARASGGATNPNHAGVGGSLHALRTLLSDLRIRVAEGPERLAVDAACVGLSGVSHSASRDIVQEAFRTAGVSVAGPRVLVSDAEVVLEEAFPAPGSRGVALIAGTGSIALARDPDGRIVRAGGLGPGRGDRGGGHWLGTEALAAGIAAGAPGRPVAELARAVVLEARGGNPRAAALLSRAADELARLVREAADLASLTGPFEVRTAGGLAANAPELVAAVGAALARLAPRASLGALVPDPIMGALRIAERALARGSDVPPGW